MYVLCTIGHNLFQGSISGATTSVPVFAETFPLFASLCKLMTAAEFVRYVNDDCDHHEAVGVRVHFWCLDSLTVKIHRHYMLGVVTTVHHIHKRHITY